MANKIQSINIVEVYEVDGKELNMPRSNKPSITICEHWNRRDFVIINIGVLSYTVCAIDLEKAIQNAVNAH